MDIGEENICEDCGKPIPQDKYGKRPRLYCDECRDARHKECARINYLSRTYRKQHKEFLYVGKDYVELKLAGLIKIPKKSKQINLRVDKRIEQLMDAK
jgi:hypothetical protein